MKKPEQPLKSDKFISFHKTSDKPFFNKYYLHPDFSKEDFLYYLPDDNEVSESNIETWWPDTDVVSLQDIIDKMPKDAKFCDINISIHRNRQIECVNVCVSHRVPNDKAAWQTEHDAEETDYQNKLIIYEKELVEFEIFQKEEKIKALQAELKLLKK